jgi:hypothetical protein
MKRWNAGPVRIAARRRDPPSCDPQAERGGPVRRLSSRSTGEGSDNGCSCPESQTEPTETLSLDAAGGFADRPCSLSYYRR